MMRDWKAAAELLLVTFVLITRTGGEDTVEVFSLTFFHPSG
jgi:hypothetical protein